MFTLSSTRIFAVLLACGLHFEVFAQFGFSPQEVNQDTLSNARVAGTESISGTVTYDGTGAGTSGDYGSFFGYNAGAVNAGAYNSFFGGYTGVNNTTGYRNSFFGVYAGNGNTTGYHNSFFGVYAGNSNTTGFQNTFLGYRAGESTTSGRQNDFLGTAAGKSNTTGNWNLFLGTNSGYYNTTGSSNAFVGNSSGFNNSTGNKNTHIGTGAGFNSIGNGNVFLGYYAGFWEKGSNKLYVSNDSTSNPLIKGDFSTKQLTFNGKVGVSTSSFPTSLGGESLSNYKLYVKGGILAEEVRVRTGWADYVFDQNYKLASLQEVKNHINKYGHLPNVPSASSVERAGLNLGEVSRIQMEKIEELTLHVIRQEETISALQAQIDELKKIVIDNARKN